jgi:hypothetical protein
MEKPSKESRKPASKEAGLFSHFINDLRTEPEKHLGTTIQAGVAAYPALKGLYREEYTMVSNTPTFEPWNCAGPQAS